MLLQSLYGPKPDIPVGEKNDAVAALNDEASGDQNEELSTDQEVAPGSSDAETPADTDAESADANQSENAAETQPKPESESESESESDEPKPETDDVAAVTTPDADLDLSDTDAEDESPDQVVAEPAFIKLGSLNPDGSDRFLVTVNQDGGTLHRVELNFRDSDGKIRYRDLDTKGGYLGSFNTVENSGQLTIVAVGRHTPAAIAGLQKDDVIEAVSLTGDDPVPPFGREFLEAWLSKNTNPGDSIELRVLRNGAQKTLTAKLAEKPVSILRPESKLVDPNFNTPESFIFSLIKPGEIEDRWPDLDDKMREGRWEVTEKTTDQVVELKFEIPEANLKALELEGPITVFKRFRLPQLAEENIHNLDSRTFHIGLEIEVKNGASDEVDLAYELDGPTGVTAETWWYANKIHGRQSALFYTAGARDVVGGTASNSYIFWGRPEIVQDATSSKPRPKRICSPVSSDPDDRRLRFAGVDSHYFNVSMIPEVPEGEYFDADSVDAYPVNRHGQLPEIPKNAALKKLIACTFQMVASAKIPAGESYKQNFDLFCGPKDIEVLQHYGLTNTRTFGWFGWCSMILLQVLHFFFALTFNTSYGLAIIMLTVLVRCIMIPFSRKAALNAQMMQHLSPQVKEINEKYGSDLEKKTAATQALYKKHKFNPLSGCFMMFFQLPIFYGLYKALNVDIALRDQPFIPGLEWCSNLAAPDKFLNWQSWMPSWIADETGYLGPFFNILPILTMFLFILQQKLFTPPATDDQQKMMQKMMMFMMIFMGFMFFKVPSGLCLYFITSSLWAVIERKLLPKPTLDTSKFSELEGDDKPAAKLTRAEKRKQANSMKVEAERMTQAEELRKTKADRQKRLKKRGGQ